jgi:thiamine-phosphate pyrophosphorylase
MTKPLLCLVTDRRRLSVAIGGADPDNCLLQQIEGAAAGGIDMVQIRECDVSAAALMNLVRQVVSICRGTTTRVVVNDRVDVAVAAQAGGVHLRDASFRATMVKRLLPVGVIGRSVHSTSTARAAGPVDYLIAGTVFATVSKPEEVKTIGIDGLREIVMAVPEVPVLAIGGITWTHARDVLATGARGAAAIGLFIPPAGSPNVARDVRAIVEKCRIMFDSASAVS